MKQAQPGNEGVVGVTGDIGRPARHRGFSAAAALVIVATLAVAASLVVFSVFRPTPPTLPKASALTQKLAASDHVPVDATPALTPALTVAGVIL